MTRTFLWMSLFAACLWIGCGDDRSPTAPVDPPEITGIADDAHGGANGFYFLPPMVPEPSYSGTALPDLLPFVTVQLCEWKSNACDEMTRLTHRSAAAERVQIVGGTTYAADLDTDAYDMRVGVDYRVRVLVGPTLLGHARLEVVNGTNGSGNGVPVQAGSTLGIRFRIEADQIWADLPSLGIDQTSVQPGAVLALEPASVTAGTGDISLLVHGEVAPVHRGDGGRWVTAMPLFLDADLWPAPPAGSVDLLLFEGDRPLAWSRNATVIETMKESPGAADAGLATLTRISGAVARMAAAVPTIAGSEQQWWLALSGTLEDLLTGDAPGSLAGALNELKGETGGVRLVDAWFASSGALAALEQYADAFEQVASAASTGSGASFVREDGTAADRLASSATTIDDVELARRIQYHEVLTLLGDQVLSETSTSYSEILELATAGAALTTEDGKPPTDGNAAKALRHAKSVAAVLSAADFLVNKVVLGMLPANVTTVELAVGNAVLHRGELTDASVTVTAENEPPEITTLNGLLDELRERLVGAAGEALPGDLDDEVTGIAEDVIDFVLEKAQEELAEYAAANTDLDLDASLGLPSMSWEATVRDARLLDLDTGDPAVVAPVEGEVDWQASETEFGETDIMARTATGVVLISLPEGTAVTGGMGSVVESNSVLVRVRDDLVLEVDFAATIPRDGFNALEARAGYLDGDGNPVWEPGIAIELVAEGGVADPTTGTTDAAGQFIAVARLDHDSDHITISVTATSGDQQTTKTAEAAVETESGRVVIDEEMYLAYGVSAMARASGGDTDSDAFDDYLTEAGALSGSAAASASAGGATSSGSVDHFSEVRLSETDTLLEIRARGTISGQTSASGNTGATSGAGSDVHVYFKVVDGPVYFELTGSGRVEDAGMGEIVLTRMVQGSNPDQFEPVVWDGAESTETRTGWLEPGDYSFDAAVSVLIGSGTNSSDGNDSASGTGQYDLIFLILPRQPEPEGS